MRYEVKESRIKGEWVVEWINHENDGEIHVTIFSGLETEKRAKEYAEWMNDVVVHVGLFNPATRKYES